MFLAEGRTSNTWVKARSVTHHFFLPGRPGMGKGEGGNSGMGGIGGIGIEGKEGVDPGGGGDPGGDGWVPGVAGGFGILTLLDLHLLLLVVVRRLCCCC